MRIISGTLKGRRFDPPMKNWPTRPTTDYAKEGLFNILDNQMDYEQISGLDLFGGTGNHCFELISRGCQKMTYVDIHYPCVKYVRLMAINLNISDQILIIRNDVRKFITSCNQQYQYIFAGPPYKLKWIDQIPTLIRKHGLLSEGGLLVLEHNPRHEFSKYAGFKEVRNYGQTLFSFFT